MEDFIAKSRYIIEILIGNCVEAWLSWQSSPLKVTECLKWGKLQWCTVTFMGAALSGSMVMFSTSDFMFGSVNSPKKITWWIDWFILHCLILQWYIWCCFVHTILCYVKNKEYRIRQFIWLCCCPERWGFLRPLYCCCVKQFFFVLKIIISIFLHNIHL